MVTNTTIHHCFCIIMTLYKHRVGDPRAASKTILTYIKSIIYYNTQLTNSVHSIYHVSPSHCLQTVFEASNHNWKIFNHNVFDHF